MSDDVFKVKVIQYFDANGRRCKSDTSGASPKTVESKKWYGRVKVKGKWKKVPLSSDKRAAMKKLSDMTTRVERGAVGLVDPDEKTKQTPIADLQADYLADLRELGRTQYYITQTGQQLDIVLAALKADTIADLDPACLEKFLTKLETSARTKNVYRQSIVGLLNWLVKKHRLADNPLRLVSKRIGDTKRKRRAETAENLQRILTAAATRGVYEATIVRRGPRKGQVGATVKPAVRAKLERIGRGRALVYLFSIYTGLRASSIRKTRVCDLCLDGPKPHVELPPTAMKSKRAFKQELRADLVELLKAWIAETGRTGTDKVFDMPTPPQISKTLRKDLAFAGVPYTDVKGRFFDFHSFRKCKGSFLRQAGVDPAVSMAQLGHSDIRMTMQVYNDEDLQPQDEALAATPKLNIP